jgi:heme-binding protein
MKTSSILAAVLAAGALLTAGVLGSPVAGAAPCSASAATGTIGAVSGATSQYLIAHPGADATLSAAIGQPPEQARASVRAYFTAHPDEYLALRGITAPLIDLQNQCGTAGLPMNLIQAFNEFQAG